MRSTSASCPTRLQPKLTDLVPTLRQSRWTSETSLLQLHGGPTACCSAFPLVMNAPTLSNLDEVLLERCGHFSRHSVGNLQASVTGGAKLHSKWKVGLLLTTEM